MVSKTGRTRKSSADESGGLRWSVEQRLAFVDERLFWLGTVNRMDLVRRFGVSMSQASADIGRYLALGSEGVSYDSSAKRYVAGDDFSPVIIRPDAGRLLGELRLADAGLLPPGASILGELPPFDAAPLPERRIAPLVLRAVLFAIRGRRVLDVTYQSMSRAAPLRRAIEPHALAYDGFRWHARAFDRETGTFRDFVLGRMSRPRRGAEAISSPADDADWHTTVELRIAPHPGLTDAQSRAIAIDYGIRGGAATITVRRALLFYALRRLGLDLTPGARPAHDQHIVLLNRDEIESVPAGDGQP